MLTIASYTAFLTAVALLLVGIVLVCIKKWVNLGKILILVFGIVPVVAFSMIIGALILAFSGFNDDIYAIAYWVSGVLVIVAIGCALWGVLKKKWVWISLCTCGAVCILAAGGNYAYNAYIDSIPTVGEGDSVLRDYIPYAQPSKVVVLDEEATLKITEDIPKMDGATALYPIYSAFAQAVYPKDVLTNRLDNEYLACTKTTTAYYQIVNGEADIIFAAEPSEEQKQYAASNGVELVYTPIGREAFVFFVNSQNPIEDISFEQVRKIYSGEITTWDELGVGGLGEITAFQRDEGSGSQSALQRIMAGKTLITPPQEEIIGGMGGIIKQTADYKNFKNAIGFSFRFYSTEMVKNNQIKLLSMNGIAPTLENIENGTYPIASEFYAVTRSDASENTKKLLEWVAGEQGQKIVELTGYTPVNK